MGYSKEVLNYLLNIWGVNDKAADANKLDGLDSAAFIKEAGDTMNGNFIINGDITGRSIAGGNASNLYKFGGIFFAPTSSGSNSPFGTQSVHSIRSTYGDTRNDSITINSFNNIRLNLDANNNNDVDPSRFEIGHNTTHTENVLFSVEENGNMRASGNIFEKGTQLSAKYLGVNGKAADANKLDGLDSSAFLRVGGKAANSNLLDGIDSSGFVRKGKDESNAFNGSHLIFNYNGITNVDYILYDGVTGSFYFNAGSAKSNKSGTANIFARNINASGSINAAGNVTAFSDRRLKTAFDPLKSDLLGKIDQLKPTYYKWKDKTGGQARQLGFIAQEVKELFPEWVHINGEHFSMSYDKMGAVLAVKGIQELHAEIKLLKKELNLLKNGITH